MNRWTILRSNLNNIIDVVDEGLDLREWEIWNYIQDTYIHDDKDGTTYIAVDCVTGKAHLSRVGVEEKRTLTVIAH